MNFLASIKISPHKFKTPEGFLICRDCVLSSIGKQSYMKSEIYPGCEEDEIIEVDRSEKEVFDEKSLASIEGKPVCLNHPDVNVTPDNYNELGVGHVQNVHKGNVDGQPVVMGDLFITDAQCIEYIENGEYTDLSCGYDCDITDGPNPEQVNIRINHVALCEEGRCQYARIVDSKVTDSFIHMFENTSSYNLPDKKLLKKYNLKLEEPKEDFGEHTKHMKALVGKREDIENCLKEMGIPEENYKEMIGDSKKFMKDSVSRGTLIQEFGKQGKQYKIAKITGNVIYAENLVDGKTVLFKKDEENIEWATITKSEVRDSVDQSMHAQEILNKANKFIKEKGLNAKAMGSVQSGKVRIVAYEDYDKVLKEFEKEFDVCDIDKELEVFRINFKDSKLKDEGAIPMKRVKKIFNDKDRAEYFKSILPYYFKPQIEEINGKWVVSFLEIDKSANKDSISKAEVRDDYVTKFAIKELLDAKSTNKNLLFQKKIHYTIDLEHTSLLSEYDGVHNYGGRRDSEYDKYVYDTLDEALVDSKKLFDEYKNKKVIEPKRYEYYSVNIVKWSSSGGNTVNENDENIGIFPTFTAYNRNEIMEPLRGKLGINDSKKKAKIDRKYWTRDSKNEDDDKLIKPNDYSSEFTQKELDDFINSLDKDTDAINNKSSRKKKVFVNQEEKEKFMKSLPKEAEVMADEFDHVFEKEGEEDRYLVYWEVYYNEPSSKLKDAAPLKKEIIDAIKSVLGDDINIDYGSRGIGNIVIRFKEEKKSPYLQNAALQGVMIALEKLGVKVNKKDSMVNKYRMEIWTDANSTELTDDADRKNWFEHKNESIKEYLNRLGFEYDKDDKIGFENEPSQEIWIYKGNGDFNEIVERLRNQTGSLISYRDPWAKSIRLRKKYLKDVFIKDSSEDHSDSFYKKAIKATESQLDKFDENQPELKENKKEFELHKNRIKRILKSQLKSYREKVSKDK